MLRLLVDGRANKEIADILSISPNTVANHVTNIMNKLGLDSRKLELPDRKRLDIDHGTPIKAILG